MNVYAEMSRAKRNCKEAEPKSYCAWSPTSSVLVMGANTVFLDLVQFELGFLSFEAPNSRTHLPQVSIFPCTLTVPFLKLVSTSWLLHNYHSLGCPVPLYLREILHKQNHECWYSAPGPSALWSPHWPPQPFEKRHSMLSEHHTWCFSLRGACARLLG